MTASLIAINVLVYVAMVVQSQHLLGFDSATLLERGRVVREPRRWKPRGGGG